MVADGEEWDLPVLFCSLQHKLMLHNINQKKYRKSLTYKIEK